MSTEIPTEEAAVAVVEQGSQALSVVSDVAHDVKLVARDADEMRAATSAMSLWFSQKQAICEEDAKELEEAFEVAHKQKWATATLKKQATLARGRAQFYGKCKEASEAGYCVVPNMPATIFAIRTEKRYPAPMKGQSWHDRTQRSESPALGGGEFVDSQPTETSCQVWEQNSKGDGEYKTRWKADEFKEIEFPISVCKPELMSETARAMALKCFDELAIVVDDKRGLDARQKKGDPLILGIIRHPDRKNTDKRMTFLIGWYLDTSTIN